MVYDSNFKSHPKGVILDKVGGGGGKINDFSVDAATC